MFIITYKFCLLISLLLLGTLSFKMFHLCTRSCANTIVGILVAS